jgi:hypothetical protein
MYIGKTDRTLWERFGEYMRERDSNAIRPKLLRLLPLYENDLFFMFAPISTGPTIVGATEQVLISAFLPPCNDRLDAEVNRVRKAF